MKLKLQYFGHLMQRADKLEKTLMLGKIEGRRRRAITVDKSVKPKRYTVFFKARDADALEEVMKNYAQRTMSREKRPSVIKLLNKMKEKVASIPHRVKQRTKQKEHSR